MKNLTVNLDDIEVTIDLEKAIQKEVEKRVKDIEKKLKKQYENENLSIDHGGRCQGNTYRTLLYAQLLASEKPDQYIFVICHSFDYAKQLFKQTLDMAHKNCLINFTRNDLRIPYENRSIIQFTTTERLYEKSRGIRNPVFLYDNY